jgi:NAD(P)-dependent dehydrogenase (short-subunit alcohol dehydrogenase family)
MTFRDSFDAPESRERINMNAQEINPNRLKDQVAIITGASRGIGAATARHLAQEGASVVLAARDESALKQVAEGITAVGGKALVVPTDVTDPASVEALVKQTVEHFGRLDIGFNNAAGGGNRPTPLADISVENFDSAIQVNLRGIFLAMKYQIPAMLANGGGAIVNMASTAGLQGVLGIAGYVASKHGIIGLTKTAALDYAQQNIRVNVVAPGPILTERLQGLPEAARQPVIQAVPIRRIGLPEEVASVVAWLCSAEAAFITGSVIPIDGGRLAGYA